MYEPIEGSNENVTGTKTCKRMKSFVRWRKFAKFAAVYRGQFMLITTNIIIVI
jgi:hypothetical protein